MLTCQECYSNFVSVWGQIWVDFYNDGHREVDEDELVEFEPKFGDEVLCRDCGFAWIYGRTLRIKS